MKRLPSGELTYPPDKAYLKMMIFPFPRLGYISFLEGIRFILIFSGKMRPIVIRYHPMIHSHIYKILKTRMLVCMQYIYANITYHWQSALMFSQLYLFIKWGLARALCKRKGSPFHKDLFIRDHLKNT